jgi:hypothetical protein
VTSVTELMEQVAAADDGRDRAERFVFRPFE